MSLQDWYSRQAGYLGEAWPADGATPAAQSPAFTTRGPSASFPKEAPPQYGLLDTAPLVPGGPPNIPGLPISDVEWRQLLAAKAKAAAIAAAKADSEPSDADPIEVWMPKRSSEVVAKQTASGHAPGKGLFPATPGKAAPKGK